MTEPKPTWDETTQRLAAENEPLLKRLAEHDMGVNCPACGVGITTGNAGGYRTYCEACVDMFVPKNRLYDNALVTMPNGEKLTISKLIDIASLRTLTPQKMDWIYLMVKAQLENDNAGNALQISPGMSDYVLRQIIYYAIDCIKGDQL